MKIPTYESYPSENCPLENCPQEIYPHKINPKKIVPYESFHYSREKLKVATMRSICSHKKKGLVASLVVTGFVEIQIPI